MNRSTTPGSKPRRAAHGCISGKIVWTPFGRFGPPRGTVDPAGTPTPDAVDRFATRPGVAASQCRAAARRDIMIRPGSRDRNGSRRCTARSKPVKAPTLRVQVRDETGQRGTSYNAFAQPKQRLDFNLTAVGTSELDVFVNNELIDSTKLGVEPPVQESQQLGPQPKNSHPAQESARILTPARPRLAPQNAARGRANRRPAPQYRRRRSTDEDRSVDSFRRFQPDRSRHGDRRRERVPTGICTST